MSEVAERYATVAQGFTAQVEGCPPEAWSAPSPCEGWTARDVAAHVVEVHRRILSRIDGGEPEALAPEADLSSAWREAREAIEAALADPERASRTVPGRFGDMTFEQLVGRILAADTLVHTWDLARATGQDERLDPEAVDAAYAALEPMDEQMRVPGGFGPKIDPPPDADPQTRLLSFLGRRV